MPTTPATLTGELTYEPPRPDNPPPLDPPVHIWGPTDPRPALPIVIPPGAIDPGGDGKPPVPSHPIVLPVYPAHPIYIPIGGLGDGKPVQPIYLPPIIWGPDDPRPQPPIHIPPGAVDPGPPPVPAHPIAIGPVIRVQPPTGPIPVLQNVDLPAGSMALYWTPLYGWVLRLD